MATNINHANILAACTYRIRLGTSHYLSKYKIMWLPHLVTGSFESIFLNFAFTLFFLRTKKLRVIILETIMIKFYCQ